MPRNLRFGMVMLVIVVSVIELQAWAFTSLAMPRGVLRFYPATVFSGMTDEQLVRQTPHGPLGWPGNDDPRSAPEMSGETCGTAFGDSLTYGAEVQDYDTWVYRLSRALGCPVANYGMPGYGLDQAVLRYERIATGGRFVVLGVYVEMLRRSVAASWTFYAPTRPMTVYQLKPYFTLDGDRPRLHPLPATPLTRDAVAAHHADDYFKRYVMVEAQFPYSIAVARALWIRMFRTDDYRQHTDTFFSTDHRSGSGVLGRRLIDRLVETAGKRNARLVVVLMPHAVRVNNESAAYDSFVADLRGRGDICVIDTKPHLREQARAFGGRLPTAPQGHHTAVGNRMIADTVIAGMRACNLAPRN